MLPSLNSARTNEVEVQLFTDIDTPLTRLYLTGTVRAMRMVCPNGILRITISPELMIYQTRV